MSDTSVVGYDSTYAGGPTGSCWTRIGANICVCILFVLMIITTVCLVLAFRRLLTIEKAEAKKMKEAGKKYKGWTLLGLFFGKSPKKGKDSSDQVQTSEPEEADDSEDESEALSADDEE